MADSIQIPQELTKVVEIEVKDTSAPLRTLLIDLVNKVNQLEERVEALENP